MQFDLHVEFLFNGTLAMACLDLPPGWWFMNCEGEVIEWMLKVIHKLFLTRGSNFVCQNYIFCVKIVKKWSINHNCC